MSGLYFSHIRNVCILGEASEEEEEIRGGTGGGECRPVGDGHGSRHSAHLQYHEGSAALYAGKFEHGTCTSLVCNFEMSPHSSKSNGNFEL